MFDSFAVVFLRFQEDLPTKDRCFLCKWLMAVGSSWLIKSPPTALNVHLQCEPLQQMPSKSKGTEPVSQRGSVSPKWEIATERVDITGPALPSWGRSIWKKIDDSPTWGVRKSQNKAKVNKSIATIVVFGSWYTDTIVEENRTAMTNGQVFPSKLLVNEIYSGKAWNTERFLQCFSKRPLAPPSAFAFSK